jgi:toxin ParE1/3/4
MRIAYSKRSLADIRRIAAETNRVFGETVAQSLGGRIRATIEQLSREPYSGHELRQKSNVYVFTLVRYPFEIFYRVFNGGMRIQHVRHTSRRSWEGQRAE